MIVYERRLLGSISNSSSAQLSRYPERGFSMLKKFRHSGRSQEVPRCACRGGLLSVLLADWRVAADLGQCGCAGGTVSDNT